MSDWNSRVGSWMLLQLRSQNCSLQNVLGLDQNSRGLMMDAADSGAEAGLGRRLILGRPGEITAIQPLPVEKTVLKNQAFRFLRIVKLNSKARLFEEFVCRVQILKEKSVTKGQIRPWR